MLASRAAAERSQCQAQRAQIDAEVKQRVARCLKARAEESRCSARNERKRSTGTLGGMALGGLLLDLAEFLPPTRLLALQLVDALL